MVNSRRFTVQILGDAKGAKKAVSDTESALGHLSVTGRATTGGLRVIGTGLKGLGVAAAGFGIATGAAMVAAGKSVVQLGIEYQNQLNTMQAVTHATDAVMRQVAQTSRDLGNDLSLPATSAADAARAMTELAKGNLTAQQAMQAAKGTLQLAAAAQIDGAAAATIQADALNAFGLKATAAGHVADVLANAANAATGEISDFAQGMQQSAAVAHQFGISLDDSVTALALFANRGIKGSDAGTSLKTALIAMVHPSKQAADAFKTLNVHAFDARGNFVGLSAISEQLAVAQSHMSKEAFNAAAATAFGTDAVRAAAVFADAGASGFNKMAAAIGRQGGAAQVAQAKTKGLGGALQGLQSQLETVKIDAFTREAPALERFVRLLSARLPDAADAALHGLDSLTGFIQNEFPAARREVEKFAPAVQHYVSDKLDLLGHAVNEVAEPALRGLGNILDGLIPKARDAGNAIDGALRSGIDAAGKVARQFEADSHDLGESIGGFADGVGQAAHEALPALRVALAGASGAASIFVPSFAGATHILAPFTSEILLAVGAVKGLQVGVAGVGAAKGQIAKVTSSFGQMADKASFAAGLVTQKVGTALGRDLETSATAGAAAMTGVRAGLSALGATIPPVAIGLLAIGYANQKMAEEQRHAIESSKAMNDQLRAGGAAAQQAQASFNTVAAQMDHVRASGAGGAAIAGKLADALAAGKKASQDAYAALSPLDQASQDVAARQADLSLAIQRYGVDSDQATAAAVRYRAALDQQKTAQEQVNAATQTGADKLNDLVDAVDALSSAQLQAKLADVQAQQGLESVAAAQAAYSAAVAQFGKNSSQAHTAQLGLTSSTIQAEEAARSAAQQARAYALANDHSGDATEHARVGAVAYRAELTRLAGQLAPGSPVRKFIEGLIHDLGAIPSSKRITIFYDTDTTAYHPPVGVAHAARATGGPVIKGLPYIVGERRPELFVPNESGRIIPRVPVAASTGRGWSGGNTYNINLAVAPGVHPAETGEAVVKAIRAYEQRSGTAWRSSN